MADADPQGRRTMEIFRASEAPTLTESGRMTVAPYAGEQGAGMRKMVEAGLLEGDEVRVLCDIPGFSLVRAWFKAGYPLPLHSHDTDCLYHIVAGTLRLGTEELGPQDSFFVPAGVPYSYRPGGEGVEVLEFRTAGAFNFVNLAKGAAFYDRAAETIAAARDGWRDAVPPSGRAPAN